MKKTSKWPSRAINLLVVLAMVISLTAIVVAPPMAAAQEQTPTCNPTPEYDGCHIEVAVNTYIKDSNFDFIPQSTFNTPDCFYVNAVVVNNGNDTAYAPINATIVLPAGVSLSAAENGQYTKTWENGNLTEASPEGLLADFWWKVCCTSANGENVIRVNVTTGDIPGDGIGCRANGTVTVTQQVPPTEKCLDIEIVEAPGMPAKQGILGNYQMTMPGTVNPCTNFGIKAEITNNCDYTLTSVPVLISWSGEADGPVGGDPTTWNIGDLAPGQTKVVGWTLHCTDPGDVEIWVTSPGHEGITNYIDDPWTVHQTTPGGLDVVITQPTETTDCAGVDQPVKQPTGDCGAQNFTVMGTIYNRGDSQVNLVYAIVSASPTPGWVQLPTPAIAGPFNLAPGGSQNVQFNMVCVGTGEGNITITASGTDSGTGFPVTGDDFVTISQKKVIAQVSQANDVNAYPIPDEVNKCQDFWVSFQYFNYSSTAWNDPAGPGNITACIHWTGDTDGYGIGPLGNATLIDSVYYRRIVGGVPQAWQLLTSSPTVTGNATAGYTSCVHIPVICSCCGAEVRWQFQCTDIGEVQFYSTLLVQQPGFTGTDTSESVCIDQVYKAHLIGDGFFFVQSDDGKMLYQEAVVPGTSFHVVIPVMNTGDADAQNVQVYFTISDAPEAPCTQSFEVISYSGDATSIVPQGGGAYVASFDVIPGHSARKAIVLVHCLCEGHVTVWVPDAVVAWGGVKGIRGYDSNTGLAIPQANIVAPPCPRELEQVPFTIVIENPNTCDTFSQYTTFPVKAKITNGSSDDMIGVTAYLDFSGPAVLLDSQSNPKVVGNITSGGSTEITWMLQCTGAGEVYLGVSATSTDPLLTTYSTAYPDTVNVHQTQPPGACLETTILSPDTWQTGQDWDASHKHPMVATGQMFAVSAKIYNGGPDDAENVIADIDPYYCSSLHYVSLADGQSAQIDLGTIPAYTFKVATWTLMGGSDSDWGLKDCNVRTDCICVNATMSTNSTCPLEFAQDTVEVSVYPAAFLVATIDSITPSTSIMAGSQFEVDYTVTNYGVADATSVAAMIAANPDGSVRIAEGQGGYTQMLGTIPGWTWGAPYNSVSGSFMLSCKQVCESTLTITPTGDDECGWHAVLGYDRHGDAEYNWVQEALRPVQGRFLIPVSETVKQLDSGQLDLSITKTVDNMFPTNGQVVNFTVTVTNNGPTAASGVMVSDSQPAGLTFGSATASQGTFSSGVWNVGNLIVGGSATLKIPATVGSTSAITNTASITAVDQPDPYTDNNSAAVTLNQPAVTSMNIALKSGWNLISLPLIPNDSDIDVVMAGVSSHVLSVWSYSSGVWSSWDPISGGDLTNMVDGKGYWINMDAAATLTINGVINPLPPLTPPTYAVVAGWNLIGFKSITAMMASDYLGDITWVRIYGYANGQYSPMNSQSMLQPGFGYWVAATSAGTIFP